MAADPTVDAPDPSAFRYDVSRPPLWAELGGMAPCRPWITYDPGPPAQACDEPQIVPAPPPANGP